jgi:hypothetical protein
MDSAVTAVFVGLLWGFKGKEEKEGKEIGGKLLYRFRLSI